VDKAVIVPKCYLCHCSAMWHQTVMSLSPSTSSAQPTGAKRRCFFTLAPVVQAVCSSSLSVYFASVGTVTVVPPLHSRSMKVVNSGRVVCKSVRLCSVYASSHWADGLMMCPSWYLTTVPLCYVDWNSVAKYGVLMKSNNINIVIE